MGTDTYKEEALKDTLKCTRCGFCQACCPVFAAVGTEPAAARGKVQLIRALDDGRIIASEALRQFAYLCLNCGACTASCPSGVDIAGLMAEARARLAREMGRPLAESLLLRGVAGDRRRLEAAAKVLALWQKLGLLRFARNVGLSGVLPRYAQDEGLPGFSLRNARNSLPRASGPEDARYRVAYFVGCATGFFDHNVGRSMLQVLTRRGVRVSVPQGVECCGVIHHNLGDLETAAALERKNVAALNRVEADAIVVDCASCGSILKGYQGLDAPVFDISEYLVNVLGLDGQGHLDACTVTYHDPCHLVRGQNLGDEARELLKSLDGLTFRELDEASWCCGGGGSFVLTHYEVSMKILERKMGNVVRTGAGMVASGCPSCRMQLRYGIEKGIGRDRDGNRIAVVHPIELLARAS